MRDRIEVNTVLTALAVFLGLYLAVGVGLFGHGFTFSHAWLALTWPYQMIGLTQAVTITLAAFTGVSLYVWRLKGRYLYTHREYESLYRGGQKSSRNFGRCSKPSRTASPCPDDVNGLGSGEMWDTSRVQALEAELAACRERAGNLEQELEDTKDRLLRALAECENLRRRFQRAKETFARLGEDKLIRTRVFEYFWRELERIEKGEAHGTVGS